MEDKPQEFAEFTLQHIKGQEEAVEKATLEENQALAKLQLAKLQLRGTEGKGGRRPPGADGLFQRP